MARNHLEESTAISSRKKGEKVFVERAALPKGGKSFSGKRGGSKLRKKIIGPGVAVGRGEEGASRLPFQ